MNSAGQGLLGPIILADPAAVEAAMPGSVVDLISKCQEAGGVNPWGLALSRQPKTVPKTACLGLWEL